MAKILDDARQNCLINFEEILSRVLGNFEGHNKVLEPSLTVTLLTWTKWWVPASASKWQMEFNSAFKGLIIVNHAIIIINTYYNYSISTQYNCYVSNKGPLEKCDKEDQMAITVAAAASCFKSRL